MNREQILREQILREQILLNRLAEARAKLRELRARRAVLVAKKKATSILATVRTLNADPATYPPRGLKPWDPKTVRQALERRGL